MIDKFLPTVLVCLAFFTMTCTGPTDSNTPNINNTVIADLYEPDNTLSTSKQIKADSAAQSRSLKMQDSDWVSISCVSGKSYRIGTSGTTDTKIKLYSSASSLIVEGDDSPGNVNALVTFNCMSSGTYYICVFGSAATTTGYYTLSVVSSIGPDSYEPDSVVQAAQTIYTTSYQNRSMTENDIDWVKCSISANDTILVTASGACFATLVLYDRDSTTVLASSPGTDSVAQIKYRITATGTYFVRITARTAGATGPYKLTLQTYSSGTLVGGDLYENDNTRATAKIISGNSTVQLRSLTVGDTDWVKLPVIAGRQYVLLCSNSSYVQATMYTKDNTLLQGPSYSLTLNSSATDTVYIRIVSTSSSSLNYTLNLSVMLQPSVPDEFEADNTKAQAKTKCFTKDSLLQDRTITFSTLYSDTDWVAFPVIAGKQYSIKTITPSSTTLYMYLYNNVSSSYVQYASSSLSTISYSPTTSDTAYLMIYRLYGSTPVAYTLSVSGQFYNDSYEPDSIRALADPITTSAQSRILLPGDTDWVMYTATPGDSVVIVTTGTTDTKIGLFSSSGSTPIIENDDIASGNLNAMVSWKSVSGGQYYIRVTGKTPSVTGTYILQALSVANGTLVAADSFETDDTKLNARLIKDSVLAGEVHSLTVNDTDWAAFPVVSGGTYTVTAAASSGSVTMYGYTARDSLFASRVSYSSASIVYTPLKNDTLYYRVTSTTVVQRYTLSMSRVLPPAPDAYEIDNIRGQAKPILPESLQTRTLTMLDTDWIKMPVTSGNIYNITTAATFTHYAYVYLASLSTYSGYNYGTSNTLVVSPLSDDTLYILVRQYSASTSYMGTYTVRVHEVAVVPVKQVSGGYNHSLILRNDGTVWTVGSNAYGQLCDGTTTSKTSPVRVATNVIAVSAGYQFSAYIKADSTLWVAGYNTYGQLGDGSSVSRYTPAQIMTGVAAVSAGYMHMLILKGDGTAWAVGSNSYGQLGDGTIESKNSPVKVMDSVRAVCAAYYHSLFIKTDSTLLTCGYNYYGQLGDGSSMNKSTPVIVATGASSITGGYYHSMFVKGDKTVWAMGYNSYGQLGNGTSTNQLAPMLVTTNGMSVAAGSYHSLIVKADNTLWATGQNTYGQLGDGTTTSKTVPIQTATGVASAYGPTYGYYTFFIKKDGTLWSTGQNTYGQLGDGTVLSKTSPVMVTF
jgi:alpha-tubulin suppressor-like RCC1 family protein